jgi:hypothetical protein
MGRFPIMINLISEVAYLKGSGMWRGNTSMFCIYDYIIVIANNHRQTLIQFQEIPILF